MRCWLRKSWSAGNREYFGQEIELIEDIREIEVVYQTQNSDEMLVKEELECWQPWVFWSRARINCEDIHEIEVVYQTQNSDEMLVRSYTCHDSHDLSMKR